MPYSRSLKATKNGTFHGVVGIYKKDALQNKLIVPQKSLGISINTFYVREKYAWHYDNLLKEKSLLNEKIGVIEGYVFKEIQTYLQKNKNTLAVQYIHGENPLEQNLQKLLKKRIDVIIDDQVVVDYTARKMGISNQIKPAGYLLDRNEITIGFSPLKPESQELVKILSKGIEQLRQNGNLNAILSEYYLFDWLHLQ